MTIKVGDNVADIENEIDNVEFINEKV